MVFVLSKHKQPLNMCYEATARMLLEQGKAVVHKIFPFTIRLNYKSERLIVKQYRLKIDPGSKVSGIAILDEKDNVVFLAELVHRGDVIVKRLKDRSGARRNRRNREIRYRHCKFINHYMKKGSKYKAETPRPDGWIPPSIRSIEHDIVNFVNKYQKLCNITSISVESVKFDTQLMDNPDISGVEYQQGTLLGYEVREFLLEKFGHTCQYCGGHSNDNVLEKEHMHSKSQGGTDTIQNLTLACHTCNQEKDYLTLPQWFEKLKSNKTHLN